MDNLFFNFSIPFIKKLDDGKTIKLVFKIFFWVLGCLCLLGGLASFILFFTNLGDLGGGAIVGGFLVTLGLVFAMWISFQILFYRAKSIDKISTGSFVVSQIVSIYFKVVGEILAVMITSVGVTTGLASLFAGRELARVAGAGSFVDMGVSAIITAPIFAFLIITLFYLLSETILCLPAIAKNSKNIARKLEADKDDSEDQG